MPPVIVRASVADAVEIADLYLRARADALPFLRRVHGDEAVRGWIRNAILVRPEIWVARAAGRIVGLLMLDGEELEQLYLLPGHYRRGVGSLLLAKAKERSPTRLHLYTFARNARARAFYEARDFRATGSSDGSRNEESEPDIRYEWTGTGIRPS